MKFVNASYEEFLKNRKHRKVIHFGASSAWKHHLRMFPDISSEVLDNTLFAVDNDEKKQGTQIEVDSRCIHIENAGKIREMSDYVILITVALAYQEDICRQLSDMGLPEDVECYSLPLMAYNFRETDNTCVETYFNEHTTAVNEPRIHSFWFSGEKKTELYKRCIDSWHKYCPDFEIFEWNAENYDVTKNQYMFEAFQHGKWAFVSDYARLDVVYHYGGIYMDMDVELLAPITQLLNADSFFCRQDDGYLELGSGFGAKAGNSLIGEMLQTYQNRKYILENGEADMTSQPIWISGVLKKHGIHRSHDSQKIGNGLILSNDYISCNAGRNPMKHPKIGVHWHNGGWLSEKERSLLKASESAKDELVEKYFTGRL